MKKILLIISLLLLLHTPPAFKASPRGQEGSARPQSPVPQKADSYGESEDDIFSSTYERELLSRRFFQKTLPPLTDREKVIWSFKTARANILL